MNEQIFTAHHRLPLIRRSGGADEPAHPVGTPFPGGQIVDEWEGDYLCPFCPAVQSDEPISGDERSEERERRRKESLNNYWTNYKG